MRSGQVEAIPVRDELIRAAQASDTEAIACLVRATIAIQWPVHYSAALIEHQGKVWNGDHVARLMAWPDRVMLVAMRGDTIVGTACLFGDSVRKVFVDPRCQGCGIGRRLIEQIERTAIGRGVKVLQVQSTINAADFYARMGFRIVNTTAVLGEPFVLMHKNL